MQSNATSTGVRAVFLWTVPDTRLYLQWMHTAVLQVASVFKKLLQEFGYPRIDISIYGISKLVYSPTVLSCGCQPCLLFAVVCSSLSVRLDLLLHIAILAALQHTPAQILLYIWQKLE